MAVAPRAAYADPRLPHLISDHMVLQRSREIPIWGKADPGEPIEVHLSQHAASTVADSVGSWQVDLPAMEAGGPFTLFVIGKRTVLIKDVMIGEVWIASGQSNMAFALSGATGASEELPKADYPNLRLFQVPKNDTLERQSDTLTAAWEACTPESARDFSAVAYYFARDVHRALNVPIGIIESAWPGTTIEEWMPPEQAQRDPRIQPMLAQWNRSEGNSFADDGTFDVQFDDFELIPAAANGQPLLLTNFNDGTTRLGMGGGSFSYDWRSGPTTLFELAAPGRGGTGFAARLAGSLAVADDARITAKFRFDGTPADLSAYSGMRFWVRGKGTFRWRSLQPDITDWDDYSAPLLHADLEWKPITIWFRDLHQDGWGVVHQFTPNAITGFALEAAPPSGYLHRPATGLYQGMIAPLLPYAFRGALWYQGESNGWRPHEYQVLLPDLIESWRAAPGQQDLQFLIVQLPNHGTTPAEPSESAWAELREAQLQTMKNIPGTGLAVTIDVGDPADIHPHRKAEVGERLALWALGTTYGRPIVYSGPIYDSMNIEGGAIRIRFTHTGMGLEARGEALRGFAIAGADRKFHWATAAIEGDTVVVSSPDVPAPVAVRYAWADNPECNFFNREGLPASPFRTDSWQANTDSK